jgi:hypothetical protein
VTVWWLGSRGATLAASLNSCSTCARSLGCADGEDRGGVSAWVKERYAGLNYGVEHIV